MITFTSGNIFDAAVPMMVNTVNCKGVMGTGLALACKERWPAMFEDYRRACARGEVRPGSLHLWKTPAGDLTIINFPTKDDWRLKSEYSYIESGLSALRCLLESLDRPRVAIPALGCRNGRLDWERVRAMIEQSLSALDADITVYAPGASRRVVEAPFSTLPDGRRVLQCHSRGDRRFTPFNCFVTAFGRRDSIENHYHRAKVFAGEISPADWREAKEMKKARVVQTGWAIGPLRLPCRSNPDHTSFVLEDPGIQFYISLWYKHLRANPGLIRVASEFDEFEDPFRGHFPFCQADVIRKVVREGLPSLLPMTAELREMLRKAA